MNPYPHPYLNHRPATGGTTVDPALQHESNTHLLQTLQNRVTSLGRAAASNASRLVVGFIIIAAVSVLALASFSMSTFSIASDINYYYPKTSSLADAIFGDDAPLLIAPPYNASLQCPTISGRADLCTYFSYVNETIDVFTLFMINGTRPNVTLASLPYTNSAPIMAGVSNGQQAIDALVVAVTNASVVGAANTADIASIEASVGSTYYVERAAVGGADTPTCGRQPLFPCATPAYALTHVAAIASPNVSLVLQLGAGLFVAPALTLPCNLAVRGAGTSTTTLVAAGLSIGSGSACANVLADLSIQLTAATNLTLTSLALRNVSFIGAPIYPLYISGPPSPLGAVIIDNVDLTGISIFSITDAQVYARSLLHGTIVTIAYTVLGGLAELYNFQVGITSFAFSTAASGVTSTLLGYGWSNPSSGAWTIATASGSTTIFRGDDGVVGLVNANNTYYGPLSSGGGTLNVQRESGAIGQAYVASITSDWLTIPNTVQTAVDQLAARVNTFATGGSNWLLLNRGIYPSGTISPSITVPAGAFEVIFEIIGGGGGGSAGTVGVEPGCGGGAGAKTFVSIPVTASTQFNGYIGAGGVEASNGEASYICVTTNGNTNCYYAGGGGGAQTASSMCIPGAGGSNDPTSGSANFDIAGIAYASTNAFDGATAGVAHCAVPGVDGKSTGDFGSGASGGCARNLGGRTYGGVPPLPFILGHNSYGGGDGAAGWANNPGQGGPDALFVSCNGGAGNDGGNGGGGGASSNGFDPCPGGISAGGPGGNGIVWYQFRYFA